jgi:plastocyanin
VATSMTNGKRLMCAAAAFLALAFAACGGNSDNSPSASGPAPSKAQPSQSKSSESEEEDTSTKTVGGQKLNFKESANVSQKSSIEVEADNFYFSPTILKGKPGQSVTLELKNEGSVTHNFTLASQNINQDLAVGQSADVKVTFPQSGTVLFHCAFHETSGMIGALQATS